MSVKPVNITAAAKANPDPHTITHTDQVKWVGPPKWTVDFGNDSPFNESKFDEGHQDSGPVKAGAQNKQYKYTITVPGNEPNDPVIILMG